MRPPTCQSPSSWAPCARSPPLMAMATRCRTRTMRGGMWVRLCVGRGCVWGREWGREWGCEHGSSLLDVDHAIVCVR